MRDARRLWKSLVRNYGPYLPLSPYLFVVLFPFYWMLITAFKRDNDLYNLTTAPFWFNETSNPSSALRTALMGGALPTTSRCMMAAFVACSVTSS